MITLRRVEQPRPRESVSPPSPSSARPVVVVGAGVIGAACAHFLAAQGCRVVMIDRGEFGKGCSHGNCGLISPSHILPLCRPGAISSSTRLFLQRNSPLRIRPRVDLQTWSWFLKFALRCNQSDMLRAGHARHALLESSRQLFQEMMDSGLLGACEWETRGLLFVHQNRRHFEEFAQTDALLRNEFGLGATQLDASQLLDLEPALKPVVAGAWLYEADAHLRPHMLMESWRTLLQRDGVEIHEHCEFLDLETNDGHVRTLQTSRGPIAVDHIVFATGAWSRQLQRKLRTRVPIEPGKGYSITMPRPTLCPSFPMIFEDHRVAITPSAGAYRIGSTMEFAGFDSVLRNRRLRFLTDTAGYYLHEPTAAPVIESWCGWRPMSCDGVPLVGRLPNWSNVWLAAGHSMLGVSMSPATGKLMAEMLTQQTPHVDPEPYRADRFMRHRLAARG